MFGLWKFTYYKIEYRNFVLPLEQVFMVLKMIEIFSVYLKVTATYIKHTNELYNGSRNNHVISQGSVIVICYIAAGNFQ